MKSIYWRPQKASRKVLVGISIVAIVGLIVVEMSGWKRDSTSIQTRLRAIDLASKSFASIKSKRLELGHQIDNRFDPMESGMIGLPISAVTSNPANLEDKQVSVNPQFAAAVVHYLEAAGVKTGDTVAIGWSGSFPALNVAVCAAVQAMDLKPIAIASAMSSQYGANFDDYLWIDMEQTLAESHLLSFRSSRISLGGAADRGLRANPEAKANCDAAIKRCHIEPIKSNKLRASIQERMAIYDQLADAKIVAYINVGGGVASTGGTDAKLAFSHGINKSIPKDMPSETDGVMQRFIKRNIPAIHLAHAQRIARELQLDSGEESFSRTGPLFVKPPNRVVAASVMAILFFVLHGFIVSDYGYRFFNWMMARVGWRQDVDLRVVNDRPMSSELAA